tara:strand:- start:947 stop:1159 length:213 start_codon:yes stop_codon:yes gene_type:complete
MNDITVFIYLVFFVALFGATFAFMFKSMTDIQMEMNRKPVRKRNIHPEMKDVQDDEELLVFSIDEDHERD